MQQAYCSTQSVILFEDKIQDGISYDIVIVERNIMLSIFISTYVMQNALFSTCTGADKI